MKRTTRKFFYKFGKIGDSVVVFVEFLQRVLAWLPILWRDRDWDYAFLLAMMQFKIRRMAACIEDNNLIESRHRVAKQLRYAAMLIDLMRDGMKSPKVKALGDDLDKKWGGYSLGDHDLNLAQQELAKKYGSLFLRKNIQTEEDYDQFGKEHLVYAQLWHQTEQDAKERLFKHMSMYINGWWD